MNPRPNRIKVLPFDLANSSAAESITDEAFKAFGTIDTVILNAGLSQRSLVQETPISVYQDLMNVNYFGNVALTQAILPRFLAQNSGQFVVITSLVGKFGTPYRSGYAASKHALHGFYDSLRAEMMMQNKPVDVTVICPGFVATNISFNALGADGKATHQYDKANAGGISPDEFAKKAVKVIEAREFEANIGGKETLGVLLKRFMPGLFAKKIARAQVR